jgi:hypothetical protein
MGCLVRVAPVDLVASPTRTPPTTVAHLAAMAAVAAAPSYVESKATDVRMTRGGKMGQSSTVVIYW